MFEIIIFVAGLIAGLIVGCLAARKLCVPKHAGVLQLYNDAEEGTSMFLELEESADNLRSAKYVIFKINEIR